MIFFTWENFFRKQKHNKFFIYRHVVQKEKKRILVPGWKFLPNYTKGWIFFMRKKKKI